MVEAWLARSIARRRRIGAGLAAYGLLGIVVVVLVAGGLGLASVRAREVLSRLEGQRDAVVRLLDATIRSVDRAQASAERLGSTLQTTNTSITQGADVARSVAGAASSVALLGSLDIFGQRPFEPLAGAFSTAASEATALAGSLDSLASSLTANAADVTALGADLEVIEEDLTGIRATIAAVDVGGTAALDLALLGLLLLLAWLLLPAIVALLVGWRLLRSAEGTMPPGRRV